MSLFVQACGSRDELLQAAAGTSPSRTTTGQRLQNEAGAEQQVVPVDKEQWNAGHELPHRFQERVSDTGRAVVP
jgi:hypothetical protein